MFSIAQLGHKFVQGVSGFCCISRSLCSNTSSFTLGFRKLEKYLIGYRKCSNTHSHSHSHSILNENLEYDHIDSVGNTSTSGRYNVCDDDYDNDDDDNNEDDYEQPVYDRASFIRNAKICANKALKVLQQDGLGFDTKAALDNLEVKVSALFVREVLIGILKNVNNANKERCAKLGYKFFVWSGEKETYNHTINTYHLIMQIFAEAEEYKAMWRLVDEMTENGYKVTSRTFNILICTCGEAGVAKKVVERFIKSNSFNFRPYKHSYNAILHTLFSVNQYQLIEWVYQQMLTADLAPDALTYNIVIYTKFRLGKYNQFNRLLDEMRKNGYPPDFHTCNILLHMYGKVNEPAAAVKLLTCMKEAGIGPSVLHFTTLIDGFSRAGNMDACKHFFNEMIKYGCEPDVVSYTVMITGHIVNGQLDKAEELFADMFDNGRIPNVYTYNAMIRGLCMAGKFDFARLMLKEMESKGCNPNFLVYSTLVSYLRKAGKFSQVQEVIKHMVEKGQYGHLLHKIKRYRRC